MKDSVISGRFKELEEQLVAATKGGVEEIDALNALAWELGFDHSERSIELVERALQLSGYGDDASQFYAKGVAFGLRALGFMNSKRSDYSTALSQLLEAQTLLETLSEQEALVDVLSEVGWVYFNLGDFPQALETLLKALKITIESKNTKKEASILVVLGAVYSEIGDMEQSIVVLQRALAYLKGTGNNRDRCIVFNNLAMTLFEMQKFDAALNNAAQSVEIARQLGSSELQAMSLDTTGQIYLARKEYAQAEDFLNRAKALCLEIGRHTDETSLNLARVAIKQERLEEAEVLLRHSLESVEARGVSRFSYQFHELLVKVYEAQGDLNNALDHYRRFHAIKSQVFNEDTQRRLGNLIVLHQVETTHIDGEIYRLKNLALRREISEHRQAMAEMEILATTDTLTSLLNRRHIMTLAGYSFEAARQAGKALVILMMDIDHFKKVNDRYGHIAGDQALAEVSATIHACLRAGDLLGRYGGEEFIAILPDTGLYGAQQVAERILKNVTEHITRFRSRDIQLTLSIGVAQARKTDPCFERLLERADHTLYAAKKAGKNQVVIDWAGDLSPS